MKREPASAVDIEWLIPRLAPYPLRLSGHLHHRLPLWVAIPSQGLRGRPPRVVISTVRPLQLTRAWFIRMIEKWTVYFYRCEVKNIYDKSSVSSEATCSRTLLTLHHHFFLDKIPPKLSFKKYGSYRILFPLVSLSSKQVETPFCFLYFFSVVKHEFRSNPSVHWLFFLAN